MLTIYLCIGSFMFGLILEREKQANISGLFLLCLSAWPWLIWKVLKKPEQEQG